MPSLILPDSHCGACVNRHVAPAWWKRGADLKPRKAIHIPGSGTRIRKMCPTATGIAASHGAFSGAGRKRVGRHHVILITGRAVVSMRRIDCALARNACSSSDSQQQSETYCSVTSFCKTTDDMTTFEGPILSREKEYHKSLNDCLGAAKDAAVIAALEAKTSATAESLATQMAGEWAIFNMDHLEPAMSWSAPAPASVKFWHTGNRGACNQRRKQGKPRPLKHNKASCNQHENPGIHTRHPVTPLPRTGSVQDRQDRNDLGGRPVLQPHATNGP